MADYEATAGLDGFSVIATDVWTAAVGDTIASNGLKMVGVMVDIPVATATGRSDLALNPPTFTSLDFTITIHQIYAGVFTYNYGLWLINDPTPADFATGATSPTAIHTAGGDISLDEQTIIGPLAAGQEITSSLDLNDVFPVYRQAAWVGRLGFILIFWRDGFAATNFNIRSSLHATTPETLVTEELHFIGGRSGNVKARSRVDRCPICGFYDVRERFIPDGYRNGLLVCTKCWDPEDPPSKPIPPDVPPIND